MRIALVAHVRHPIAPPFAGGIETQTHLLARRLLARGHDVVLFATGDSDPALPLRPIAAEHYDRRLGWGDWRGSERLTALTDAIYAGALHAIRADGRFDVVYNNALHRFPPRAARAWRLPMVSAMHVPPFHPLDEAVRDAVCPWHLTTVTSRAQAASWDLSGARVVGNGIDLDAWPDAPGPGTGAVWAGRILPTKAPHLAIDAARAAGVPLRLYGPVEDRAYFDAEVAPRLGPEAVWEGSLAPADLAARLGAAAVLVFTPAWDEPFGLVAAEAMACGTPVAAFAAGAAAEVVGASGVVAPPGDVTALAEAIQAARAIPRAAVRADAEARLSVDAQLDAVEPLFAEAIAARDLDWPPVRFPETALPAIA